MHTTHTTTRRRLLITAGPTHEPIDDVRYLANRSSGRLGIALAHTAADMGWCVTLLLGPVGNAPGRTDTHLRTIGFRSTADLERLLYEHFTNNNVLIMAAAVADYRPVPGAMGGGKLRRDKKNIMLELEPTPDLLAGCARSRRADQVLVGFALEPRERLMSSAREKIARKGIDLIVANPLETMDADTIEATLIAAQARRLDDGTTSDIVAQTDGAISKTDFAPWLLARIEAFRAAYSPS